MEEGDVEFARDPSNSVAAFWAAETSEDRADAVVCGGIVSLGSIGRDEVLGRDDISFVDERLVTFDGGFLLLLKPCIFWR